MDDNSSIYRFGIKLSFISFLVIASSIIIYLQTNIIEKDKYLLTHFLQVESKILKINNHTKKWIVASLKSENLETSYNKAFISLVMNNGKSIFLYCFMF